MGSCCPKSTTRMIKIGASQAGIIGLDEILNKIRSEGLTEKRDLERELLALARDHGNYVASSAEEMYKEGLLREYEDFCRKESR